MIRHVINKHAEHECKICNLKFKTSMDALKHASKDHSSNNVEDKRESESLMKKKNILAMINTNVSSVRK